MNGHYLRWSCSSDVRLSEKVHMTSFAAKVHTQQQFFCNFLWKKNVKNRLSASTTRGSIANIISYWYRLKENFIGFPTKKTACKSNKNSLQAWPIHQGMYICIFPHFCHFHYGCLIFCHCWCKVLVGLKSQKKAFLTWMHQILLPFHSVNENLKIFNEISALHLSMTIILQLGRPKLGK